MAQDYGAAQPIYDVLHKAATHAKRFLDSMDNLPGIPKKPDTIDHDWIANQAKRATASFAKQQPKAATPKPTGAPKAKPGSFKKGGTVKQTGMAKVHKGEKVLTVKQVKSAKKKGK